MALPESAFQKPYFIEYVEGATLLRNDSARFDDMNYQYGGRAWRNEPQPGYNAQNPSLTPDMFNLSTEVPYIRAR